VKVEEVKILLALEPLWTAAVDGKEFIALRAADIEVEGTTLRFSRYTRRILDVQWLRPNVVRLQVRSALRSRTEVVTFYPGDRLPAGIDARKRRRAFQRQIAEALCKYFGARAIERQTLYSDKIHGVGGAYPRFLLRAASHIAAICVDPDETHAVVNGVMRAAVLWSSVLGRRVSVVVPAGRTQTVASRLQAAPKLRSGFDWLQWDGSEISPLALEAPQPETHIDAYQAPEVGAEVDRICALAPGLLQPVQYIPGRAVSVRLRGIELARVTQNGATYPLGYPLEPIIEEIVRERRHGSRHPLARAHEERWLESNLIGSLGKLLPVRSEWIYPQVPSFSGEERSIIDLLTITGDGRLVVIEVKASADPDLPFQALDYWLAVERHRKAGDFAAKGYFKGIRIQDQPALLVLVAPLLAFHKTLDRLVGLLPNSVPLVRIGINQEWKREIKILHRQGLLS